MALSDVSQDYNNTLILTLAHTQYVTAMSLTCALTIRRGTIDRGP